MRVAFLVGLLVAAAGAVAQDLPDPITNEDYFPVSLEEAKLGQLLFYDPILSGNKNIACATCHHPAHGTSDGVALGLGEGAVGLGPDRRIDPVHPPEKRIPRNSPALFNLGAREFTVLFHDGLLEADANRLNGIRTPMDDDMVAGFASVLSAQTMFPVLSRDEMAGNHRENDVGRAVRQGLITGPGGAWDQIARRVAAIPAYADRFVSVYPDLASPDAISFTDISNAIAAFMALEWRSDTAPFDAVLRGERTLAGPAQRGAALFYGSANCASCHAGPFLTDHGFHAMGAPQIGPGKAATFESHQRDEGRFRVTGDPADLYAFRTPSLRNILLTAPYGHAGAHADLHSFLADHANPEPGLESFDPTAVKLVEFAENDFAVMEDSAERARIADAVVAPAITLSDTQIADLVAFLETLSDPEANRGRLGIPDSVPSGLPVPNPD